MNKFTLNLNSEQLREIQESLKLYNYLGDNFYRELSEEEWKKLEKIKIPTFADPTKYKELYHLSVLNGFHDDEYEIYHQYIDNDYNMNIHDEMKDRFGKPGRPANHTKNFMTWVWDNIDLAMIPDMNIQQKCFKLLKQESLSKKNKEELLKLQDELYDRMCYDRIVPGDKYLK